MVFDNLLRRVLQISRARVIAQAAPQPQHLVLGRAGERGDVGEALQKSGVKRYHRRNLGLLQHDLRDPDAIGVVRPLPGKIVAAVALVPGEQAGGEVSVHAGTGR